MIKLLIGQPGMGKTKDIIKHANESLKTSKGNVVFISESNESMLEINHDIRYINMSEFPIESSKEFVGFLLGVLGGNYDIEKIYLDGIQNLFIMSPEETCKWLERINEIGENRKIQFEISISISGDVPECLKRFL